jgi:hypothetical protein
MRRQTAGAGPAALRGTNSCLLLLPSADWLPLGAGAAHGNIFFQTLLNNGPSDVGEKSFTSIAIRAFGNR